MANDEHRIPGDLKAAARLGAAKELGLVVIHVRDVRARTRSLYLAEDTGLHPCAERWMDHWATVKRKQGYRVEFNAADMQYERWSGNAQPTRRKRERVYRVTEHLGTMPEGVRSTTILDAEGVGVPILDWPGDRLPYRVEFPDE